MSRFILLCVIECILGGCDSRGNSVTPTDTDFHGELSCDFTKENVIASMSPSGRDNGYAIVYMGQFKVTVKLPHGGVFSGDAFLVTAKKGPNSEIETFHITTAADTLEATCQQAQRIIEDWKLTRKNLDEWKKEVAKDPNYAYSFDSMNNSVYPSYSLAIRRSLVEGKPWCLFLEIHWIRPSKR